MSTIPSTQNWLPLSGVGAPTTPTAAAAPSSLSNQNVFMQLLVTQLKNQDPQNPADGTQFVTQLAQFTTLQENTQSAQDLNAILKIMTPATPAAPTTTTATNTAPKA